MSFIGLATAGMPRWAWSAVAAVAIAAAAAAGGWAARGVVADRDIQTLIGSHAVAMNRLADAARQAEAEQRGLEARRNNRRQEILDAETIRARARPAAVRRADVAGDGLRYEADALASAFSAPSGDTEAAGSCQAAAAALRVQADVFADMERTGRELALEAEERGAAGAVCEALYDSLTEPGEPDMNQTTKPRFLIPTPTPTPAPSPAAAPAPDLTPSTKVPTRALPTDEAGWREQHIELARVDLAWRQQAEVEAQKRHAEQTAQNSAILAALVELLKVSEAASAAEVAGTHRAQLVALASTLPGTYTESKAVTALRVRLAAVETVAADRKKAKA